MVPKALGVQRAAALVLQPVKIIGQHMCHSVLRVRVVLNVVELDYLCYNT